MKRIITGAALCLATIPIWAGTPANSTEMTTKPAPALEGAPSVPTTAVLRAAQPTTTVARPRVSSQSVTSSPRPVQRRWQEVRVRGIEISIPTDPAYQCRRFEPAFKKYGLTPVKVWSYIAWRESRCEPKVIGWNYKPGTDHTDCKLAPAEIYRRCKAVSSYDSGLLQINSTWVTVTAQVCGTKRGDLKPLRTVECNLRVAKYLFDNGGLGHWGFPKGS